MTASFQPFITVPSYTFEIQVKDSTGFWLPTGEYFDNEEQADRHVESYLACDVNARYQQKELFNSGE